MTVPGPSRRSGSASSVVSASLASATPAAGDSRKLPARSLASIRDSTCALSAASPPHAWSVYLLRSSAVLTSSALRKMSLAWGFQAVKALPPGARGRPVQQPVREIQTCCTPGGKNSAAGGLQTAHLLVEPGLGHRPQAVGGAPADAQGFGRFLVGEACEIAEFHQFRRLGVVPLQFR